MDYLNRSAKKIADEKDESIRPRLVRIGVLALQGAFVEHIKQLQRAYELIKDELCSMTLEPVKITRREQLEVRFSRHI